MIVKFEGNDTARPPFGEGVVGSRMVPRILPNSIAPRRDTVAHRLNSLTAASIVLLLLLAPIPLGSNYPAYWMIWSTVIGGMALVYGLALLGFRAQPRFALATIAPEAIAFLVLCAFMVAQTLPIGGWLPGIVHGVVPGIKQRTISLDPGNSQLVLIQFFSFGLLFFIAAQVGVNRKRARRLIFGLLLLISLFAVIGLLSLIQWGDTLLGFDKQAYLGYATGTFINRNSFATFLAVGLTLGSVLLVDSVAERDSATIGELVARFAVVVGCLVVIAAALLATGSRMGTFAGLSGAATAFILRVLLTKGLGKGGVAFTALLLVCGAIAVLVFFGGALVERLVLLPGVDQSRVDVHRIIWSAILERPLLGYGAGSFATAFEYFQAPPLSAEFIWDKSHSTYLALWFELGLVVGSLPLLIIAQLGFRIVRAARDPMSVTVSIAAVGTMVVFALHSLMDFSAEIEANALLFTVVLALGAAGDLGRGGKRDKA